jgi:glucosamine-6-phosphate deaminase
MDSLHPKERDLAVYLLDQPADAVQMTITELARNSGSSSATVSRFCRSFHFNNFPEFKMKLAAELAQPVDSAKYQDIVAGNPLPDIVSALTVNHLRSLTDTTQLLDITQLRSAIHALHMASRIDLYGVATSGVVAQDFFQKLIRIGKAAAVFMDPHLQLTSASSLTEKDVAIGISYSGETPETIHALQCAADQGAMTISITKFGSTTLSTIADIRLFTSSSEEGMRRGDMASRMAQLLVPEGQTIYGQRGEDYQMNILKFDTDAKLNEAGAGIITGLIQTNPRAVLGLATGGTPTGIYEHVVSDFKRGMFSFKNVTTFNLDEYVGLPIEHVESYHKYMQKNLLQQIDLPLSQAHIPDGNAPDADAECARYDELIDLAGQIDLQLLGLGHNGHIGFNEPAHALIRGAHVVELAEETLQANARFFDSIDDVPKRAITMGVGTILKAKMILLVVKGSDKADIVHRALKGPITTDCPASLLQTHPHLIVLLDNAAAAKL